MAKYHKPNKPEFNQMMTMSTCLFSQREQLQHYHSFNKMAFCRSHIKIHLLAWKLVYFGLLKFNWNLFHWVLFKTSKYWLRQWLANTSNSCSKCRLKQTSWYDLPLVQIHSYKLHYEDTTSQTVWTYHCQWQQTFHRLWSLQIVT